MQISDSVQWIFSPQLRWGCFRNRPYRAMIQLAEPGRIYNVPGQPGVVYNTLEDSYAQVSPGGYIITGLLGEMWPIGPESLGKYDILPEQIQAEPQPVMTRPLPDLYAGILIPKETAFDVTAHYGEKTTVLHGNRPGIAHGCGDWVLVTTEEVNGTVRPRFAGNGRIINGILFPKIYRPVVMQIMKKTK